MHLLFLDFIMHVLLESIQSGLPVIVNCARQANIRLEALDFAWTVLILDIVEQRIVFEVK